MSTLHRALPRRRRVLHVIQNLNYGGMERVLGECLGRGIKVVARALRDAGFHVIYAGLWQTPEAVVRAIADEDADWVGLSLLSGAHMTLVPRVLELLKQEGLANVGVMVGGIVPEADLPKLHEMGVARVFGPGTPLPEIVAFLKQPRSPADA